MSVYLFWTQHSPNMGRTKSEKNKARRDWKFGVANVAEANNELSAESGMENAMTVVEE